MEPGIWPTYFKVSDSRSEQIRQFWDDLMKLGEDRSETDEPSALTFYLFSYPHRFLGLFKGA